MRPIQNDTAAVITDGFTDEEIAAEWRRRSGRGGLSRVMRASQPPALNADVTERTLAIVADYLDAVSLALRRPVGAALEVGCGVGRVTPTIARMAERVVALDMTAEMLHAARQACAGLHNIEFIQRPARDLPCGRSPFDVTVCVWVLMHVLDADQLTAACRAIARSSRYLVLVEYELARIPVGPYSRLRFLDEYLELLPGARLMERRELFYGGDRSFAALIALGRQDRP